MADGRNALFALLKAHAKEARIGGSLGLSGSLSFLFIDATSGIHNFWTWVIKLLFMCLSTFCTAVIGAWAKDTYDNFKQYRKKKENEYRKRKGKGDQKGRAA